MITDATLMSKQYLDAIGHDIHVATISDKCFEITVPFLNRANDHLQIYMTFNADYVYFSDDCETVKEMELHGISVDRDKMTDVARQFGVQLFEHKDSGDIEVGHRVPPCDFAKGLHMFVQAVFLLSNLK